MTEASNVASAATEGASDVASEAGTQAKAVASEAKQQLDRLVTQGRDEVRLQAEQRSSQAAGQLRALGALRRLGRGETGGCRAARRLRERCAAPAPGRGGSSGAGWTARHRQRRHSVRSPPSLAFLAGAASAGFVVGRVVRAGAASGHDDSQPSDDRESTEMTRVGASQPSPVSPSSPGDAVTTPPDGSSVGEPPPLPPPTSRERTGP